MKIKILFLSISLQKQTNKNMICAPIQYKNQDDLLLENIMQFYNKPENLDRILQIINGNSKTSLRIIDWFVTNYAKKYYVVYNIPFLPPTPTPTNDAVGGGDGDAAGAAPPPPPQPITPQQRFKVYNDYKLKLKAYSKKRFDPFCRWERIQLPCGNGEYITTTIGQLNFTRWMLCNDVLEYINAHYKEIEQDMLSRNTMSKKKNPKQQNGEKATRKVRQELSKSACKSLKCEKVDVLISFKPFAAGAAAAAACGDTHLQNI